jgi:hypothetical protein
MGRIEGTSLRLDNFPALRGSSRPISPAARAIRGADAGRTCHRRGVFAGSPKAPSGGVPLRPALSKVPSEGFAIVALLAGTNDLIAIFRWGQRLKPEALLLLGVGEGVASLVRTPPFSAAKAANVDPSR